jgi:hypothetical protein
LPFDPTELRRLSAATDTSRTLIGVEPGDDGGLAIWGLVNSGTRWLRDVRGGRRAGAPLLPAPVVHVDVPGSLAVYKGDALVARLQAGTLSGWRADPFVSEWLLRQFRRFDDEVMARHRRAAYRARDTSGEHWTPLASSLPRLISQRMTKRVIALLREAGHGGTIVFLPMEHARDLAGDDPCVDLKYRFVEGAAQQSFPDLVARILNRVAQIHGAAGDDRPAVGWRDFELATDDQLATLDEALFETAYRIAGLAAVDGAVVMNVQHELLGFGGMIPSRLRAVRTVARALDLEARHVAHERTDNVGARHRSAYRLAGALRGAVVIVISQDGGARFVSQKDGRVTYWEQE